MINYLKPNRLIFQLEVIQLISILIKHRFDLSFNPIAFLIRVTPKSTLKVQLYFINLRLQLY